MPGGHPKIRETLCAAACALAGLLALPGAAAATELIGTLHAHSGYSDGWPGSRPADYYESGKAFGLDFLGGSDHSDTLALPLVASDYCADDPTPCALADPVESADSFRKWDATAEQAAAATTPGFTAFRGFEWTSDRFGHINVYFSRNYSNAKSDGGYAAMDTFWSWLTTGPDLGGGADGVATFNHPGAKKLSEDDPGFNWNDFAYVPAADRRMVGIEVFNDNDDFGSAGPAEGWYAHTLDRGWHLGAVGAEDLGHRREDDWGGPSWAKTVIDAADRSPEALRAAMLARRFYAVRDGALRMRFEIDDAPMGSRIDREAGERLDVDASVSDHELSLDLITSGGQVVDSGGDRLHLRRDASAEEGWYFVRARAGDRPMAYSSPIWIDAIDDRDDTWLAGDLHVHTCYSHDVYCGPNDENTGPDEIYTAGLPVEGRFAEASARGLDFLAITDHNDVRSVTDPGFDTHGVTGVPAYENSLHGHAQMLGATRIYPHGDGSAADVTGQAEAVRADGGLFQINHPVATPGSITSCDPGEMDWGYGYSVVPDTLEVWNLATAGLADSTAWWECWLDRGVHLPATGGSDSHWLSTLAAQGIGNPTTWVLASRNTTEGVLAGIRADRTSITRLAPGSGVTPLVIEADPQGDGSFEPAIGRTLAPGTPLRISGGGPLGGLVRVRANDETILDDAQLEPGGEILLDAPEESGWLRAELRLLPSAVQDLLGCSEPAGLPNTVPCAGDQVLAALTSPVYLEKPQEGGGGPGPDPDPDPGPTRSPADGPQQGQIGQSGSQGQPPGHHRRKHKRSKKHRRHKKH